MMTRMKLVPAEATEEMQRLLTAAMHALRSYQFGNGSPLLAEDIADQICACLTALNERHQDDLAVDRFAAAMKEKLGQKRDEGRFGWDDPALCTNEYLSELLRKHVEKGDPVDVGNFAMMLHQRGERIAARLEALA